MTGCVLLPNGNAADMMINFQIMKEMTVNPASSIASIMVLVVAFSASAQESAGPLVDSTQASQIAAMMYEGYLSVKVNQMLKDENDCWEDSARRKPISKAIASGCAIAAFSGGIIEASYARQQGRGSHPQYTGEAVRARVMKKSRLPETEAQQILDETVRPNMEAVMSGLVGAGMR